MKGHLNRDKNKGFTILEVLIVLAVTMVMFFISAAFVNGRQGQVEFNNSVAEFKSRLTSVIDNTLNGNYPDQKFTCTGNNPTTPLQPVISITGTPSDTGQGTHDNCLFLGKVLEFTPTMLNVYTVFGNSIDNTNPAIPVPINSYSQQGAKPVVAPLTQLTVSYPYVGSAKVVCQQFGMTTPIQTSMSSTCSPSATETNLGGLALLFGNNQYNNQQLTDVALDTSQASPGSPGYASGINTIKGKSAIETSTYINPLGGTQICLASSSSNQSALFTIGGNGNEDSVSEIGFEDLTCT